MASRVRANLNNQLTSVTPAADTGAQPSQKSPTAEDYLRNAFFALQKGNHDEVATDLENARKLLGAVADPNSPKYDPKNPGTHLADTIMSRDEATREHDQLMKNLPKPSGPGVPHTSETIPQIIQRGEDALRRGDCYAAMTALDQLYVDKGAAGNTKVFEYSAKRDMKCGFKM